ncbi:hypothetical protein CW304_19210 [Bacillus sp. UFRGS-B20]|nr:hypothetical protein CW304_19210 [Bacillus sp. UFRGS-B20]
MRFLLFFISIFRKIFYCFGVVHLLLGRTFFYSSHYGWYLLGFIRTMLGWLMIRRLEGEVKLLIFGNYLEIRIRRILK